MSIVRIVITFCLCNTAQLNINWPSYKAEPPETVSPILHAAYHERIDEVTRLLDENPYLLRQYSRPGPTLLGEAVIRNNLKMVRIILQRIPYDWRRLIEIGVPIINSSPLREAVKNKNGDIALLLLEYGADASATTTNDISILHDAAGPYHSNEVVEVILGPNRDRVRTNVIDFRGRLPISYAIERGDVEMVRLLKSANDYNPITLRDGLGNSVFHIAAAKRNIACLHALYEPDGTRKYLNQQNDLGNTALHIAAIEEVSLPTIQWLLNHGASAQILNRYKQNALHISAMNGLVGSVQVLVTNGVHIDKRDTFARTPMHYAAANLFSSVVRELIENQATLGLMVENKKVELHLAVTKYPNPVITGRLRKTLVRERAPIGVQERQNVIRELLLGHAAAQRRDGNGNTPLHIAVSEGFVEAARLLIPVTYLATVNNAGETVLMTACKNNVDQILPSIFSKNDGEFDECRIYRHSHLGMTALDYAVERNFINICDKLVVEGAVPNTHSERGPTPFHKAVQNQNDEIVRSLIRRIPVREIDYRDSKGNTALHLAVSHDNTNIVKRLLDAGAQPDAVDSQGNTALHLALSNMNNVGELIDDLLKHHASTDILNKIGELPIHVAAQKSDISIIEKILTPENRGDLQKLDSQQCTPLHHAVSRCYTTAVEYFTKPAFIDQHPDPPEYVRNALQLARFIVDFDRESANCEATLERLQSLFYHSEGAPEPQAQPRSSDACAHPLHMSATAGASSSSVSDLLHSCTSSAAVVSSSQAVPTEAAKRKSLASTPDEQPAQKKPNLFGNTEYEETLMQIKTVPREDAVGTLPMEGRLGKGENLVSQGAVSTRPRGGEANTRADERVDRTGFQGVLEALEAELGDNLFKGSETEPSFLSRISRHPESDDNDRTVDKT